VPPLPEGAAQAGSLVELEHERAVQPEPFAIPNPHVGDPPVDEGPVALHVEDVGTERDIVLAIDHPGPPVGPDGLSASHDLLEGVLPVGWRPQ
jgi:hypothetical protein